MNFSIFEKLNLILCYFAKLIQTINESSDEFSDSICETEDKWHGEQLAY